MSGGHFDYKEQSILDISDSIRELIDTKNYLPETIAEFKIARNYLLQVYVYVKRIDKLISGDDRENSFHERLKEDLAHLYLEKV